MLFIFVIFSRIKTKTDTRKNYARTLPKLSARFFFGLFAFGFCFDPAAQEAPAPATNNFTGLQIIESWGWIIAQEKNLAGIEISGAERQLFLKGFSEGVKNEPAPCDLQKSFAEVEKLAKARREKITRAIIQKNEAAANLFFAVLKTNANVVTLPGGVFCEILKPSDGALPKPQQTVSVHYTARLLDGTEFDQMGRLIWCL